MKSKAKTLKTILSCHFYQKFQLLLRFRTLFNFIEKTIPGGRSATATTFGEAGTPTPRGGGKSISRYRLNMAGAMLARHFLQQYLLRRRRK